MGNEIVTCTDSKTSVLAVGVLYLKHQIVRDIQEYCNHENTIRLCWVPNHVGVQMNESVDQAAKRAIENLVTDVGIPRTDLKAQVKATITGKFNDRWNEPQNNKLKVKEVKPFSKPFNNIHSLIGHGREK